MRMGRGSMGKDGGCNVTGQRQSFAKSLFQSISHHPKFRVTDLPSDLPSFLCRDTASYRVA